MKLHSKLPHAGISIFSQMSQLANQHQAINLSQGFPDFDCDPELINIVEQFMKSGQNQYAPMSGVQVLRERIAEKQFELHQSEYHPETEVTITAGGTQAIFTAISTCINPGDEVIIFEPAYDSYIPSVELFGGIIRPLELSPPYYHIDWDAVAALINQKTKLIILNSPNNPSGTLLSEDDISALIRITQNTNILILSDEVYEHLIYDGKQHLSLSAYSELRERSFICASFGKLFHTTGWKVGYCLAPEHLMREFQKIHQFMVFSINTPVQLGIAEFLKNKNHYIQLSNFFEEKRNFFRNLLSSTAFELLPCEGSYFQLLRYTNISSESDLSFARQLITEYGVAAIPVSAFYSNEADHKVLRFCFAKQQETLQKAVDKLMSIRGNL